MKAFHDLVMGPGSLRDAGFTPGLRIERPAFLIVSNPAASLKLVTLTSVQIGGEEQIAVEHGCPAEVFASEDAPLSFLVLPPAPAFERVTFSFANPLGAPVAHFRLWFGEHDAIAFERGLMRGPK